MICYSFLNEDLVASYGTCKGEPFIPVRFNQLDIHSIELVT